MTTLIESGAWILGTVAPFLLVLTTVVFFHELGHYFVGRWNGIKIEAFAVGFGPELFGWTDKRGTRWKVCAIPLGGYVKFLGDEGVASTPDHEALANMSPGELEGTYESKKVWQRSLVAAAGPAANFILAIVIFTATFFANGSYVVDPVVGEVRQGTAAMEAGIKPGDKIISVNGDAIASFRELQDAIQLSAGESLTIVVDRGGESTTLVATPRMTEQKDRFGNSYSVGILGVTSRKGKDNFRKIEHGLVSATTLAVKETWSVAARTLKFLGQVIVGRQDASQLRGPVGIAQISSQVATLGYDRLITLAAVLSISIGLLNLFPIPMLDGGHLAFYAIEAIRRRPLSIKAQEMGYRFGLLCMLGLMIFATRNDILRLLPG
jgi:regulator of sigma E protease